MFTTESETDGSGAGSRAGSKSSRSVVALESSFVFVSVSSDFVETGDGLSLSPAESGGGLSVSPSAALLAPSSSAAAPDADAFSSGAPSEN